MSLTEQLILEFGKEGIRLFSDLALWDTLFMKTSEVAVFVWDERKQIHAIVFNYLHIRRGFNEEQLEDLCHELEHYDLTKLLKKIKMKANEHGLYPEWITFNPSFEGAMKNEKKE